MLAFFERGGASNGPVEAINGCLAHLRGIGLGFRNFEHYVLRCLLHSGQLSTDAGASQNRTAVLTRQCEAGYCPM